MWQYNNLKRDMQEEAHQSYLKYIQDKKEYTKLNIPYYSKKIK